MPNSSREGSQFFFLENSVFFKCYRLLSYVLFYTKRLKSLKRLSNDPGKVDNTFFCYASTVLSPYRNVLILTQRMHKPA